MKLYCKVARCTSCEPTCGWWFGAPIDLNPNLPLVFKAAFASGYLVMSDQLPKTDVPSDYLELREAGYIPGLAEEPCSYWRFRIRRMYQAGFRFIWLQERKPGRAREFRQEAFDEPEVAA